MAFRLAQHYREREELPRSAELVGRLLDTGPAREEWLGFYVEVLTEDGAQPRARAALERARQAGLSPERARALQKGRPRRRKRKSTTRASWLQRLCGA